MANSVKQAHAPTEYPASSKNKKPEEKVIMSGKTS